MKKEEKKTLKLEIKKETLKELTTQDLTKIVGGEGPSYGCGR